MIPNRSESIRKLLKKLGTPEVRRVGYEAVPTANIRVINRRDSCRPPSVLLRNHSKIDLT
jgi:hypothetical protein